MRFYCGLDLSARTCQVCVVDENMKVFVQQKVRNELFLIIRLIEPYKETLEIVVESTLNWYWLVDGLEEAGYRICLAHTLGLYMITGAKVKTDKRDAFALAKLLRAGVIPQAYIYPKKDRPIRDLVRRRARLVRLRASEYLSMSGLMLSHGILNYTRNDIKQVIDEDIEMIFRSPWLRIHAKHELRRIWLYTQQIREMEQLIFKTVTDCTQYRRLLQITGIGEILAITIYYEVGDIKRFKSARHFSSYCRVVPGVAQSGTSSKRGRGGKQGNAYLKWAFSQAAVHAIRYSPKIKRCYQRHLRRHRGRAGKLIARSIIAHKLAQAVFYVLRDGVQYKEQMLFGN